MIEFHGKSIPTTLEELVYPRYTALVVVDMQNDYCTKGGVNQKHGRCMSKGDAIIKKLKVLIKEARRVDVQIVYVQMTALPDYMSDSAARLRLQMKRDDRWRGNPEVKVLEGSWGHEIVEDIKPRDGDLVVKKNRASAFVGTNLDMLLRSNDIKVLLITGVVTQGCVFSTVKDAEFHDYFVVILRDCADSTSKDLHHAALKIMEARPYDVVDSDQIIEIWKKTYK